MTVGRDDVDNNRAELLSDTIELMVGVKIVDDQSPGAVHVDDGMGLT